MKAVHRIANELVRTALGAAGPDESSERGGLQVGDQLRGAGAQHLDLRAAGGPERLGDLQQVPGNHLVVGFRSRPCVYGAGERFRIGIERIVLRLWAGQRGLRKPEPELRPGRVAIGRALAVGGGRDDGKPIEREGVEPKVRPHRPLFRRSQPDGAAVLGVHGQQEQQLAELVGLQSS